MLKTILLFIKTHTIATAITTTVVVSTVVATPIIVNQVQKPKQEIETGQVQENIPDNTVIDNTVEEETETPEENTTVPEEEQKVETPKEETKQDQNKNQETAKPTTPTSNTSTTKPTTNSQPETVTEMENKFDKSRAVKFYACTDPNDYMSYDPVAKVIYYDSSFFLPHSRETFLNNDYPMFAGHKTENIEGSIRVDRINGIYNQDYYQQKIAEVANEIYIYQEALEYYKLNKDTIQLTDQNTYLYKGRYWEGNIEVAENYIKQNLAQQKAEYEEKLKTALQYRP